MSCPFFINKLFVPLHDKRLNKEIMKNSITNIKRYLEDLISKSHGSNGCVFISGAVTITGDFYGFSVGPIKPDSIVLTTKNGTYKLNADGLATTDDIVDYISEGQYVPVNFTSITTTGTGYLIAYNK